MNSPSRAFTLALFTHAIAASGSNAHAQCQTWSSRFADPATTSDVLALAEFDDGGSNGPALFAGGSFPQPGGATKYVVRWDGWTWSTQGSFDSIVEAIHALARFDFGAGLRLVAGGKAFGCGGVWVREGVNWVSLGNGPMNALGRLDPVVYALAGYDGALYAGGDFDAGTCVVEPNVTKYIAKWNGLTWVDVGGGMNFWVLALTVFDDGLGGGPALYAGGEFAQAGGVNANHIAKWNGTTWSPLGSGLNQGVYALAVFDDGSGGGQALYAGGFFTTAGGASALRVAKWNGSTWSALGSGVSSGVRALTVFDDETGGGPALFAGGVFTAAGGASANRIAKWNGSTWSALGAGMDNGVRALAAHDDGNGGGPDLYAGGLFVQAGGNASRYFGQWFGCEHDGEGYCFGDGIDPLVTAMCPCTNFGDPGHGCANSNSALRGARLVASGTTSPNTLLLKCTGIPNNTLCTFLRGFNHDPAGAVFGDGIKCLTSPLFRFGSQNAGQIGNPPNTVEVGSLNAFPGSTVYYVLQYRNPVPAFCPPGLFNASNGYRVVW